MKENSVFKSLKYRNYRLYFFGQSISLVGTWMQRMAISWLVYRMTHSPFILGAVSFAGQIPTFIFSPYAGVIVDRYNRYKILLVTQIASMIQAILLSALVLSGHYHVYQILILSTILGIINAFDTPSRQSLVFELVDDKKDLPNAIAINSSMVNLARLLGPAVAGLLLMKFGEGICFSINAASFIAVLASLLLMRLQGNNFVKKNKNVFKDFKEGYEYLQQNPTLKVTIFMIGLLGLLVMPYNTLIPVFAKDIFKGDASTFGWLNSASGLGALAGAFYLASYSAKINLKKVLLFFNFVLGTSLTLFSFNRNFPMAMFFSMFCGFGMMSQFTISNTLIQTSVSDEMRGRVTSFYVMAVMGMQPFGSFMIGSVAHLIGTPQTVMAEGVICLIISAFYLRYLIKNNLFKTPEVEATV